MEITGFALLDYLVRKSWLCEVVILHPEDQALAVKALVFKQLEILIDMTPMAILPNKSLPVGWCSCFGGRR